jgi:hypothetical protein
MKNRSSRGPRPRPTWPRQARGAVIVTAMAAAALLTAACSASPSSGAGGAPNGGAANSATAVAYTSCMRSHGVANYPDPDSSGQIPKVTSATQLGVSDARLTAAEGACQSLWPYQSSQSQNQQQQIMSNGLKLAQCMRAHGVPLFPDPTIGPNGPRFVVSVSKDGINPHSSAQYYTKAHACERELPAGARLPSLSVTK